MSTSAVPPLRMPEEVNAIPAMKRGLLQSCEYNIEYHTRELEKNKLRVKILKENPGLEALIDQIFDF